LSTKLYTLADLVGILGTSTQKMHDWTERANEKGLYVEPDFVAGRGNQYGKSLIRLWTEGQLEDVIKAFKEYRQLIDNRRAGKIVHPEHLRAARRQYQGNYRNRQKAKKEAEKVEVFKTLPPSPKPMAPKPSKPKPLTYTPPSVEALEYTDEFDDQDRANRAMQLLIEKGLV
jgi:hypothetical protein